MSERIELAAIKRAPDNKVFVGKSHADIFMSRGDLMGGKQGFITNELRFVDRETAALIAFKAGQTDKDKKMLMSEDLTGDFPWLKDTLKSLAAELADYKAILKDSPDQAEFDALVFRKNMLESELAKVKEANRWIPVEERLPKDNKYVSVTDGFFVRTAYWSKECNRWFFRCKVCQLLLLPTHWRPITLPEEQP